MATSNITIASLTATPSLRGNKLAATYSATGPAANIPTLMLDSIEFYSSTTNDFTTATKVVEGKPEAVHAGLIEEQTYYYWAKPRAVNGSYGAVYPASPTAGVACTAIGMSGLAFGLANGNLVASVAANALTVAVKTAAGNDPSASDPVYIAFSNSALATGNYQIRTIAAALSIVISSGSLLGTANSTPFRIWVVIFDDGGTLRLGVIVCSSFAVQAIYPLPASGLASSIAEGGAGAADSYGIIYTGVAVSSKPFRILGYLDWNTGLATAGAWSAGPDAIRLFGPGTPKPGDVVQDFGTNDAAGGAGGTTTVPLDNTVPQKTEGNVTNFSVQITPTSPINFVDFDVLFNLTYSVASPIIGAMFRDSGASAFAAVWCYVGGADQTAQLAFRYRQQMADAAQRTYSYRVGGSNAGTLRIGATSGGAALGGTLYNYHGVKELMG